MDKRILNSTAFKRGYGTVDELLQEVGEEGLRHLQLGGYIKNGLSREGETFCLSKKGKKVLYYYGNEIKKSHRIQNFFLHNLLGFNSAY